MIAKDEVVQHTADEATAENPETPDATDDDADQPAPPESLPVWLRVVLIVQTLGKVSKDEYSNPLNTDTTIRPIPGLYTNVILRCSVIFQSICQIEIKIPFSSCTKKLMPLDRYNKRMNNSTPKENHVNKNLVRVRLSIVITRLYLYLRYRKTPNGINRAMAGKTNVKNICCCDSISFYSFFSLPLLLVYE